jgi:adenine-specific DNA-methyltransferase
VSRLNDLLRELRTREPALARDFELEIGALADRRAFGLNFERHVPEAVELPGRRVRKGDKVRILPPRGQDSKNADEKLWRVVGIDRSARSAKLESLAGPSQDLGNAVASTGEVREETTSAALDDLVVVAEFRDPIYPGLVSTGKVQRGGDKPFHTVINAENFHALETLLFTHRGTVDCIYIDPPYNTGAKDWRYNNDYVETDDLYRHSKWLAMMERRLLLAKELIATSGSIIVTIDEHEVHRLGLLLSQVFPEFNQQLVTIVNNPKGVTQDFLSRVEEYAIFCFGPEARVSSVPDDLLTHREQPIETSESQRPRWKGLLRSGDESLREDRPNMFYPVWLDAKTHKLDHAGDPLPLGENPRFDIVQNGLVAAWPVRRDGAQGRWGLGADTLNSLIRRGLASCGSFDKRRKTWGICYLSEQLRDDLEAGKLEIQGIDPVTGVADVVYTQGSFRRARTVWHRSSHDAGAHGTDLIGSLLGAGRAFPFPKSLYAVEDAVRLIIGEKKESTIIDFFAGSGTTTHAVMRLNKQDGGRRQCILVTNNEVAPDEQKGLRDKGLRPGDPEWEQHGICELITKPRIAAAITGKTPEGEPIVGNYKFTDEFPIAEGFEENVEFFTLTYEAPLRVASHREFAKIAPLLWIRAGARGRRIDDIYRGWDVADVYGVLADLDHAKEFLKAVGASSAVTTAYIVTDEERLFESVAQDLPDHVEPVRLYEAYLRNFEIESGRGAL